MTRRKEARMLTPTDLPQAAHEAAQRWQPTSETVAALKALLHQYGIGVLLRVAYEDGYCDGVTAAHAEEW
jgi:hypothetical protein